MCVKSWILAYLGTISDTQGWVLRRCLSHINRISSRPYRPKDPEIRELCGASGITWPEPVVEDGEHTEDDDFQEEDSESEITTTDEECEVEVPKEG